MKRFFFAFSVILVAVMIIMAGAYAALHYGAIWTETKWDETHKPVMVNGWNVTGIPFIGNSIIYPGGDIHIVHQATAADVKAGDVVLFSGGSSWFVRSGCVESITADTVRLTLTDKTVLDEPAQSVRAVYRYRIPSLWTVMELASSPPAIGIFTLVLLASIILWRKLPGKTRQDGEGLSRSDEDIATILY